MLGDLDLFANLPLEIKSEIISRAPIKTIIMCKLVCKPWLDLVESQYFIESHFSKRHPHLFVSQDNYYSKSYKILEFVSGNGAPDVAVNLHLPDNEPVHSSVNGLILLSRGESLKYISLCNPLTREYFPLPDPPRLWIKGKAGFIGNVGFGVSKRSGKYKIVQISKYNNKCLVYTLGTGQWKRVAGGAPPTLRYDTVCAFVGGNLYWLVYGSESWKPQISCFDLETEVFSSFPAPPRLYAPESFYMSLSVLGDRLCFCDDSTFSESVVVIWLMREDGCWTKEFVVKVAPCSNHGYVFPIKVFENGDMLLGNMEFERVFYFSKKTNNVEIYNRNSLYPARTVLYTPNFLPLKTLAMDISENVQSF